MKSINISPNGNVVRRKRRNVAVTKVNMSFLLVLIAVCAVPPFSMVQAIEKDASVPAAAKTTVAFSRDKNHRAVVDEPTESEDEELNSADEFVRTYSVFTVPPFEVRLTLPASKNSELSDTKNSAANLDLLQASKDLEQATHDFMMEQTRKQLVVPNYLHSAKLDAYLKIAGYANDRRGRLLRGRELQKHVTIREMEETDPKMRDQMFMVAEFSGHIAFNDDAVDVSIGQNRIHQNDVRGMIAKIFQPEQPEDETSENEYFQKIKSSRNELFQSLIDVHVVPNTDLFEDDASSPSDGNDASVQNLGASGPENNEDPVQQQKDDGGIGDLSHSESIAVFSMGVFLVVFIASAYVYVSHQHRKERLDEMFNGKDETFDMGHEDSSGSENDSNFEDDGDVSSDLAVAAQESARPRPLPGYASAEDKYHTIHSQEVIAVPARPSTIDDKRIEKKMRSRSYGGDSGAPVRRQYIQPASPFDVLYGAAFLHKDQERVEKSYYKNSKNRSGRKNKSRDRSRRAMMANPMMSIAETVEEHENESGLGPTSMETSFAPVAVPPPGSGGGAFHLLTNPIHNMLGRITGYGNGYDGLNYDNVAEGEYYDPVSKTNKPYYQDGDLGYDDVEEPKFVDEDSPRGVTQLLFGDDAVVSEQDKNLVFRDFPRHDGTPCLMYTPTEKAKAMKSAERAVDQINGDDEGSLEGEFRVKGKPIDSSASMATHKIHECSDYNDSTGSQEDLNESVHSVSSAASIDNFVDKLERLMEHRTRQYQERLAMEKERVARKKQREEERKMRKQKTNVNNSDVNGFGEEKEKDIAKDSINGGNAGDDDCQIEQGDSNTADENNRNSSTEEKVESEDQSSTIDDSNIASKQEILIQQEDNTTAAEMTSISAPAATCTSKEDNVPLTAIDSSTHENNANIDSNATAVFMSTQNTFPSEEVRTEDDSIGLEHESQQEQEAKSSPPILPSASLDEVLMSRCSSFEDNPDDLDYQDHSDNEVDNEIDRFTAEHEKDNNIKAVEEEGEADANINNSDNVIRVDDGMLT